MSVRRLADEVIQPESFAFTPENQAWAEKKMAEYPPGRQQSAVIPLLFRAQEQQGWVSRPAIEEVGRMLDMAYIRVLEVATFYTQFQLKPVGTNAHIQVCGTTPCMLRGAEALRDVCQRKINHEPFETNPEGTMSWEEVECLGACVNAPMVMVGSDTYEDLTPERLEEIIDAFAAGKGDSISPGPQIDRQFGAAEGGRTTLLEEPTAERTYQAFPPKEEDKPAARPTPAATPAPADKKTEQAPTKAGRVDGEVPEEAAPALKAPEGAPKVSQAEAEAERAETAAEAGADGKPNRAMREDAHGAESDAGKIDGGARDGGPPEARGSDPTAPDDKPLFTPTGAEREDLKVITGIGPVLERKLNELGITTWAQVAAMNDADVDKLETRLNFKGRIARDRWIEQGKALTSGGLEEHRRQFGKGAK